jgi:hypothetical protein|tara:strand:+ start:612 stop:863 length:252 start_codon:yes stop_codon:yes gene_type:complete
MGGILEPWDEDEDEGAWDIIWIHEIEDGNGSIRIGLTPDEKFFLLQTPEKTVKLSIDYLLSVRAMELTRDALMEKLKQSGVLN